MSRRSIARSYAAALLALAEDRKQVAEVERDLDQVADLWQQAPELRQVAENPTFSTEAQAQVVAAVLERLGVGTLVRHTLALMAQKRRLGCLAELFPAFSDLAAASTGTLHAKVTTAKPLPDAFYVRLTQMLASVAGREVVIRRRSDPALIAGVCTQIGDMVFDGSLQGRLRRLRASLLTAPE
ncbi:MAG: ATP synthase F1 subunit delta [Polyangiales bacterium]